MVFLFSFNPRFRTLDCGCSPVVGYYWGKAVLFIVCRQYHNENTISCVLMTGKHYMYFTIKAAFDNLSLFLLIDLFYSHKTSIANFPDAVLVLFSQFSASTSLTKRKPLTLVRGKIFKRDFFLRCSPRTISSSGISLKCLPRTYHLFILS